MGFAPPSSPEWIARHAWLKITRLEAQSRSRPPRKGEDHPAERLTDAVMKPVGRPEAGQGGRGQGVASGAGQGRSGQEPGSRGVEGAGSEGDVSTASALWLCGNPA